MSYADKVILWTMFGILSAAYWIFPLIPSTPRGTDSRPYACYVVEAPRDE